MLSSIALLLALASLSQVAATGVASGFSPTVESGFSATVEPAFSATVESGFSATVESGFSRTLQQSVIVRVTADGQPVAGARVSSGGQLGETDGRGLVTLLLPDIPADVAVDAEGFLPATVHVAARPADGALEISLEPLPEFEEEVVVNASRSPTRIQDQPLRVEIIDREEIEEKALMTPGSVAMLIGETTGLRVQPTAPSLGAANVRIQGLRGRYSQMLADGLPLYGGQGDSFSLLQVPPLDLGQVEIIKGAASALYGASALGGVINLVSRRPMTAGREVLLNQTSLGGSDATFWLSDPSTSRWTWTLLSGFHYQSRRDLDDDGWTDVAGYERGMVRPRLFYSNGGDSTVMMTGGVIFEDRRGGTLDGYVAPDGSAFLESLGTSRGDAAGIVRHVLPSRHLVSVRGSYGRDSQDRTFGGVRERGTRSTGFGEVSLQGASTRHTWVAGAAYEHDGYDAVDLPAFDYSFNAPALFAQDEFGGGSARVSLSGRLDFHDEYGTLASPRASLLWRPDPDWTVRVSAGGGAFAPTPFIEDTDETGLSRVAPLEGLEAERAWGGSLDVTRRVGGLEVTATFFASDVGNPVQLVPESTDADATNGQFVLVNAGGPTKTWGSELLGRYRSGPFLAIATYAFVRSRELDEESGTRREVPLTPRHYATTDLMFESEEWGRVGLELYYIGQQELEDNPYRTTGVGQFIVGALVEKRFERFRLFVNAENLGNVRQTNYDPLVRPERHPDGRWTVDAWAPLDGRVINGGVRVFF
jgi:iron complex outermembrane receptor protein